MSDLKIRNAFLLILSVFALLLCYRLGGWGVLETSEARYAEMSWEMYRTGDLLHPTFLQLRHYHKPPLTYAITAGAYQLFGPSPFAARFFLQLGLLVQLLLVYRIGRMVFQDRARARLATLIYLSFPILRLAAILPASPMNSGILTGRTATTKPPGKHCSKNGAFNHPSSSVTAPRTHWTSICCKASTYGTKLAVTLFTQVDRF